jgi:ribonuclease J
MMVVRNNREFCEIIQKFDPKESIMLYSMWDGYRTKPGSTIPDFLNLVGAWETLHTSGHATHDDIKLMVDIAKPDRIVPIHTDAPDALVTLFPHSKVIIAQDGKEMLV